MSDTIIILNVEYNGLGISLEENWGKIEINIGNKKGEDITLSVEDIFALVSLLPLVVNKLNEIISKTHVR